MNDAELIALLRVVEHDARAEELFVKLAPGASVKWSLARLASEAADLIEAKAQARLEEDRSHIRTIEERDALQDLFDDLYSALMGAGPEYSNLFNATDAFNDMEAEIRRLRSARSRALEEAAGVAKNIAKSLVPEGAPANTALAIAAAILALKEKP